MTPPENTPVSMILQDATSATGIYASIAQVIRRSGAVYSSNDHNAHRLDDLRWFRKQASGHYVLTDAPRSWVQPNELTAHGTDPVMIAREIQRAAQ